MARAISVNQLLTKRRRLMQFDGEWLDAFGCPELAGVWFIWGNSSNGKTTFVLQLCKYLTKFGRVAYNSMEEGDSESMKLAFQRVDLSSCARRIILLDNEPIDELKERLRLHKAQRIIVIDSIQYSNMSYSDYKELRNEFRDVLFIIVSHAKGKEPKDNRADSIRYDASVKIWIEGFKAFITSRYRTGDVAEMVIWKEQAEKYFGQI